MKQRLWGAKLSGWASSVQQLTYAGMLVFGTYLVLDGEITTGTMVACSLLSSRTIAPLMQLTMVFSRWQHAKNAMKGLDDLLQKPLDRPDDQKMSHCPALSGHYQLRNVQYAYDEEKQLNVLNVAKLDIAPGEKIAILGRVGAGKSTLLKLLSGQASATQGKVIIDGVNIAHVDPADLRRQLGYLSQESRLFFGTLRQNLMLGSPHATEKEMIQALKISGALGMIQQDAASLDRLINEGGRGLSGGQKQMVMLSRMILRNPQVVLMDEPTASMDEQLEEQVLTQLAQWMTGRTMIVVTHRPALLKLVDRIVVVDNGRIVADGPRDQILQASAQASQAANDAKRQVLASAATEYNHE
ncbi:RTX-I toxin determinant B [Budvicia aquatica]|uniref:RTX-I toxin determinant B n=1 Tax=Budvicia aquatica TaxID=82979 RepID=A0A484ZPR2_9GAMM|nr:RTX-I toxin determinant B [Budvicia aquatica]